MEKQKKIRRKVKGQGLHNSLDGYLTSLKEASVVTSIPDSNTVVIHVPKHVKELVFIDQKELDKFLSGVSRLVQKLTDLITTIVTQDEDEGDQDEQA